MHNFHSSRFLWVFSPFSNIFRRQLLVAAIHLHVLGIQRPEKNNCILLSKFHASSVHLISRIYIVRLGLLCSPHFTLAFHPGNYCIAWRTATHWWPFCDAAWLREDVEVCTFFVRFWFGDKLTSFKICMRMFVNVMRWIKIIAVEKIPAVSHSSLQCPCHCEIFRRKWRGIAVFEVTGLNLCHTVLLIIPLRRMRYQKFSY